MTDSEALRNLINSKGIRLKYVANYLGLSPYGLQLKIDNRKEFKVSEVDALCDLLHITSLKEKDVLFFKKESDLKSSSYLHSNKR